MREEGEKEKVVANCKEACGKEKACLVSVTLWDKNDGSVHAQVHKNNCLVLWPLLCECTAEVPPAKERSCT